MKKINSFLLSLIAAVALLGPVAMATDLTVGGTTEMPSNRSAKMFVLKSPAVNFATYNLSSNAIHSVINIPADTLVLGCVLDVTTASTDTATATHTIAVGDGLDDNGWVAATAITNTTTVATTTEDGYSLATDSGKLYTAADTIDILAGTNLTTGVLSVYAICVDVSD